MLMDAMTIFQGEIGEGERILWSGQPRQGLMLRPMDAFMIPFSLLWAGFAIFWEIMVIVEEAPFFFMLWGIPFVLVGLYAVVGRFFLEAKQREKTCYALTNERIIIISGLFARNVKTLNLKTLSEINLNQKRNGSGTITFGASHPLAMWYSTMPWPGMGRYNSPSFDMIESVKEVYALIRKAQREL